MESQNRSGSRISSRHGRGFLWFLKGDQRLSDRKTDSTADDPMEIKAPVQLKPTNICTSTSSGARGACDNCKSERTPVEKTQTSGFNQLDDMVRRATSCGVMVSCAVMMMMMMMRMSEVRARPSVSRNRRLSEDVRTFPLQIDLGVLASIPGARSLHNVSISPWTYDISQDNSVFPQLSEARCLLRGCLDHNGQEDESLSSQPIMHQVLQLRRVRAASEAGQYPFRLESRLLAVGCVCTRPSFVIQQ